MGSFGTSYVYIVERERNRRRINIIDSDAAGKSGEEGNIFKKEKRK